MSIPRKFVAMFASPKTVLAALCAFFLAAAISAAGAASNLAKLSDGAGAYATGRYANLFTEEGYSKKEISAKIQAAFQQLFHGDPATESIYFESGKNANG